MILIAALGFPVSKWNGLLTGILILNYWPSWVLRPLFTTLDRPNADTIGDKLSCFWISALITLLNFVFRTVAVAGKQETGPSLIKLKKAGVLNLRPKLVIAFPHSSCNNYLALA